MEVTTGAARPYAPLLAETLAFARYVAYRRAMRTNPEGGPGRQVPVNERIAIGLWLGGAALYLAVETAVATAFSPRYDYARNYISDLGVPACGISYAGHTICSPLHGLMNLDFGIQGCLFAAAALAISRSLSTPARYGFVACAVLNGLGNVLVGLFPETAPGPLIGPLPCHAFGALLAIIFGNGAALASAWAFRGLGLAPLHRRAARALPVVAAGALAMLIVARTPSLPSLLPEAIWERLSVYPITVWEVMSALCLIAARRARD